MLLPGVRTYFTGGRPSKHFFMSFSEGQTFNFSSFSLRSSSSLFFVGAHACAFAVFLSTGISFLWRISFSQSKTKKKSYIPLTGKHEPNKLTCSQLCDFVGQLVRGIAEVMGSNPVESPEFFRFTRHLLKLSSKSEDHIFIWFQTPHFLFSCLGLRVFD